MSATATGGGDRLGIELAGALTRLLEGLAVGSHFEVPPSADICYCLELFLPRCLRDRYPEWDKESLDGIFVARATKIGPTTAEFVGSCILISDQTVTPFAAEIETAGAGSSVIIRRLRLGEPGTGRLGISGPPVNSKDAQRLLASIGERIDDVEWSYMLERRT